MTMIVLPEFCADWSRYEGQPDAVRRAYVSEELRRLDADGAPLLTVVLAHVLDDRVQQVAFERLRRNDDGEGGQVYAPREWRLRLVEGGVPPSVDGQSRPLPPELRGKALKAKVGVLGDDLGPEADAREVQRWSAQQRDARRRMGRDIYRYVTITRQPTTVSFDDAVAVLRQWGVGVARRQHRREPDGSDGQLQWLVEEITPSSRVQPATEGGGGQRDKSSRQAAHAGA